MTTAQSIPMTDAITRLKAMPPVPGAMAAADFLVKCAAHLTHTHDVIVAAQAVVLHAMAVGAQEEARNATSAYLLAKVVHGYPDGAPELATITDALAALQGSVVQRLEQLAGGAAMSEAQLEPAKAGVYFGVCIVSREGLVDVIVPGIRECITPGEARRLAALLNEAADAATIQINIPPELKSEASQ